ncbi:MAG: LysR family transcriptional regulator [Bryobacterales bacterium]|nr:LysR family transcriptional regulator [Bryobacterales bacterium]
MDLEPRLLRYFIAVAEELNFGRAATKLHLSQPSLSVAIKSLESIYGVKLLNRHSRHVDLTDSGYRFLPVARKTIAELDSAADFLRDVARGEPEVFRIGYSPFLNMQLVGFIRLEFTRTNSGVPTILVGCPTAVQIKALQKAELDAGLLVAGLVPQLKSERLGREPLRVAFRRGHRLQRLNQLSFLDIVEEPVIWFRRDLNPAFHDQIFQAWVSSGHAPRIVQEVETVLECLQFASQGIGITFATPSQLSMRIKGIAFRELTDERFCFETAVAYRADNQTDSLQRFLTFVRQRLQHCV